MMDCTAERLRPIVTHSPYPYRSPDIFISVAYVITGFHTVQKFDTVEKSVIHA
jgi:hypothetical protein